MLRIIRYRQNDMAIEGKGRPLGQTDLDGLKRGAKEGSGRVRMTLRLQRKMMVRTFQQAQAVSHPG